MKAPALFILLDAENINQPHLVIEALEQARSAGAIVAAVAIVPDNPSKEMRRVLDEANISILPRLAEMPANAGDAMLACAALQEAIAPRYDTTDFCWISNDLGFGGPAAILRSKGFRCWRICSHLVGGSKAGFDGVASIGQRQIHTEVALPSDIFPQGQTRIDLAYFGNQLTRRYPDLKQSIFRFGRTLGVALARCAEANKWPIRLVTQSDTTLILLT